MPQTEEQTVVIISDSAVVDGGAAKVALQTAKVLTDAGYTVIYFAGGSEADSYYLRGVDVRLVNKDSLRHSKNRVSAALNGIFDKNVYRELFFLLDKLNKKNSIVHVHSWASVLSPSIFRAIYNAEIPCVVTAHDYCLGCPNSCLYDFTKCEICRRYPLSPSCILHDCDRDSYLVKLFRILRYRSQLRELRKLKPGIIFVSNFQKDKLEPLLRFKMASFVVRNPIEGSFENLEENKRASETCRFLYVGRVEAEKGVDLFCKAALRLGCEAIVLGDGKERASLQKQFSGMKFKGWATKDDVIDAMRESTALVIPSRWYEASPLTPIEAMMNAALPCIVADSCAAVDDVIDGVTGCVFESGSTSSLVKAMEIAEEMECGLRKKIVASSKDLAKARSFEEYLKNLRWVYSETISRKTHGSKLV